MNLDQTPVAKQDLQEALDAVVQSVVATLRGEIVASEQRVHAEIVASEQRSQNFIRAVENNLLNAVHAEIMGSEERSQEFARNIETNMLTAFHGHARGQTARLHSAESNTSDLAIRVAALEDRMLNVECRRPPQ